VFRTPIIGSSFILCNTEYLLTKANNERQDCFSLLNKENGKFLRHEFGKLKEDLPSNEDILFADDSSFIIKIENEDYVIVCSNPGYENIYIVFNNNEELYISENGIKATINFLNSNVFEKDIFDKQQDKIIKSISNIETKIKEIQDIDKKLSMLNNKIMETANYQAKFYEQNIISDWLRHNTAHSPLVSIILPVYNVEAYLKDSLRSILEQNMSLFELICVDDGSTDSSYSILKDYAKRDTRIKLFKKDHQGASSARNFGLRHATGQYLSFLDADDVYDKKMLYEMVRHAQDDRLDIVVCRSKSIRDGNIDKMIWTIDSQYLPKTEVFNKDDVEDSLFQIFNGWAWDKLFRKDFIDEHGLTFQEIPVTNDAYFVFIALCLADRIGIVDEYLATHRYHNGSLEDTRSKNSFCFLDAINRIEQTLKELGLFNKLRQTFYNWILTFSRWQYTTLKLEDKTKIKNSLISEFEKKQLLTAVNGIYKRDDISWLVSENFFNGPLISVIIPVYNAHLYLAETLNSVINQSLKDIEIICINDGSEDNSLSILNWYASSDSRIVVIDQQNLGAGAVRNAGMKVARGAYLAFLDSDDIYKPDFLEKMFIEAKTYDCDIVISKYERFENGTNITTLIDKAVDMELIPHCKPFNYTTIAHCFFDAFIAIAWNKIFKREFIEENGLQFQNLINSNDTFFVYSAMLLANRISAIDESLIRYRIRKDSLVRTKDAAPLCFIEALEAIYTRIISLGIFPEMEKTFYSRVFNNLSWNISKLLPETIESIKSDVIDFCHRIGIMNQEEYQQGIYDLFTESQVLQPMKESELLISIIVPVYNAEKYLRQCVESVLKQDLKNIELILVDDGSTDSSLQILREYENQDSRVKVITQHNQYAGIARNNGLSVAKGKYIHFLDSDDYVTQHGYHDIIQFLNKNNPNIVKFGNYAYDDCTGKFINDKWVNMGRIKQEFYGRAINIFDNYHMIISYTPDNPWSGIYKKDFLDKKKIRFDNLQCCNDTSFFVTCLIKSQDIHYYDKYLIVHRRNVKDSLIDKRIYHFDDQIKQYFIINDIIKTENNTVVTETKLRLINNLFHFYIKFITNDQYSDDIKNSLESQMLDFIKKFKISDFTGIRDIHKEYLNTLISKF
jgi:glycosyltransferase involved in cell wall biosynthesis